MIQRRFEAFSLKWVVEIFMAQRPFFDTAADSTAYRHLSAFYADTSVRQRTHDRRWSVSVCPLPHTKSKQAHTQENAVHHRQRPLLLSASQMGGT
jgi:hypothetical protein